MPPRGMEQNCILDDFIKFKSNNLPKNFHVTIIPLYSTTVYPQAVKLNNSRYYNYILWDNHFWDLYDRFLFFAQFFQKTDKESSYEVIQDYLLSLSLLFLSNRFEKYPALSFIFSHKYKNKYCSAAPYNVQDGSGYQMLYEYGCSHMSDISKWLVYFHEMSHVAIDYKKQSDSHDNFELIVFYAQVFSECLDELVFHDDNLVNEQRKSKLQKMINKILVEHDEKYVAELYCDVDAILSTFFLLDKSDESIAALYISWQHLSIFQLWLYLIETGWNNFYRLNSESIENDSDEKTLVVTTDLIEQINAEAHSRNYITWWIAESVLRGDYSEYDSLLDKAHEVSFFENEKNANAFTQMLSQSVSKGLVEDILRDYNEIKEHEFKYDYTAKKDEYVGWY
jgi:hypothetical protein